MQSWGCFLEQVPWFLIELDWQWTAMWGFWRYTTITVVRLPHTLNFSKASLFSQVQQSSLGMFTGSGLHRYNREHFISYNSTTEWNKYLRSHKYRHFPTVAFHLIPKKFFLHQKKKKLYIRNCKIHLNQAVYYHTMWQLTNCSAFLLTHDYFKYSLW